MRFFGKIATVKKGHGHGKGCSVCHPKTEAKGIPGTRKSARVSVKIAITAGRGDCS